MGQGRHTLRSISDPVYPREGRKEGEKRQREHAETPDQLTPIFDRGYAIVNTTMY